MSANMASVLDQYRRLWIIGLVLVCCMIVFGLTVVFFKLQSDDGNALSGVPAYPTTPEEWDAYEIELFREYLRIPSVHPNVDYKPCVAFLKRQADSLDLPVAVHIPVCARRPVVVITWTGSDPTLPSILLNSHMDVVPVYADQWAYPPFAAEIDDSGRIFARGAQDMKSVGAQYLAAIRALKRSGLKRLRRTVHLIYAPDEEVGSAYGWKDFVESDEFAALNVGFFLDEGMPSESTRLDVYYAARKSVKVYVNCVGDSGHGLYIMPNTAAQKALAVANKMYEMRDTEEQRLKQNASLTVGDVTTINFTMLKGGLQSNVIPREVGLVFDIRLAIDVPQMRFRENVIQWVAAAGTNITVKFDMEAGRDVPTVVGPSNPFWVALENALVKSNLTAVPRVLAAAQDSRFIRRLNKPAFGFSPLSETPVRIHDHNEFITSETYLKGIRVYERIITNLANVG